MAAAAAPAAPRVDPKQSFRELKDLFPMKSRSWLRRYAYLGVERISNYILDNDNGVAESRYENTEDEGSGDENVPAGPPPPPPPNPQLTQQQRLLVQQQLQQQRQQQLLQQQRQQERHQQQEAARRAREEAAANQGAGAGAAAQGGGPGAAGQAAAGGGGQEERAEQPRRDDQQAGNDTVSPARKQLKLVQLRPQQQQAQAQAQQQQQPAQPPFVMAPIQPREKCSVYPCQHKPLVARVFCQGPMKTHTLCVGCCTARLHALRPAPADADAYTCVVGRCRNTIPTREMLGVAAAHAPALHAALMQRADEANRERAELQARQQQHQQLRARIRAEVAVAAAIGQQAEEPSTPVASRASSQAGGVAAAAAGDATTPRVVRRLSQMTKPISWTPSRRGGEGGDALPVVGEEQGDPNEEEPAVEEGDAEEELRAHAAMVDREKLKTLQKCFPKTAVGWLVRHADYGMETLIEMVTANKADPLQLRRADGRGATTIVEETMAARVQFECSVCFCEYDEHLAITCVWLEKRRRTMAPGEAAPSADELAAERDEEAKGRREAHKFCADCVRGHAGAAVEQQVIMHAGVGIKCMEPSCKNALLRAHIEQVLDLQTRAILDPLFSNEALLAANCEDVEKCQRCPFAGVMLDTKEVQPIFKCEAPGCGHMHCRKCGRSWLPDHQNRTCEELDPEAVRRRVEEQLTEAAMFKCPRCKRGIVKADGCNKIACPCGQLSCYVCKAAIENYKHFKNGPAEEKLDKCPLWVDPTAKVEAARLDLLKQKIDGAQDDATREALRQLQ